ncbi:hypothetical protein L1987_80548 [Smallanthus sonchifolius]|uniref:Uncharacterized protein n=1 Tax=Smallanthus sonchifolius TaxID=185202 RepID=A0ACB8YPJ1_9ASTR|nr:hypothetical protein L1987_80548 [Smallanthus sonchifolius]
MDILRHSRRSKSFSFSDTISDDPSATLLGIPFSWEQFPGIPKNNTHKNDHKSSQNLLPLPPSTNSVHHSPTMKKYSTSRSFRNDPFLAAFVECSKDKEFESKHRSRFAVSMYSSCKRTCAVSESIVYRPRSSAGYILATDEDLSVAKSKP